MAQATDAQKGKNADLRRGLMLYGSTAAMAAALMLAEGGVGPALAQEIGPRVTPSFAAQGDFTAPGPTPAPSFEFRSNTLDIVHMNRDAVLNWTTYDTAPPGGAQGNSYVNFLPEGTELRFVGNGESFTAINRVFTTPDAGGAYRGIAIQGQVTSYLSGDGPNSVGAVGGNIWFFSPGGILATGTARFNVGSLVLSASDLENFSEFGTARSVDFTGVADPFASVILKPGARVTLTQPNSSFAVVAPTIEQGGEVSVDGSVLYVSAEQGRVYFYNLGEIAVGVDVEARAGNEIRHLGTTTGPASTGTDDFFTVYDPQTIEFRTGSDVGVLLSGTIGYGAATSAELAPNGSIILTAGSVSGSGDLALTSDTMINAGAVDLSFGAGEGLLMGSDANGGYALDIRADAITLAAGAGGSIDIAGDLRLRPFSGPSRVGVTAAGADGNGNPGGTITIGGNFLAETNRDQLGLSQVGGTVEVAIGNGGTLDVAGDLSLMSDGFAAPFENSFVFAEGGRAVLAMTGPNAALSVGGLLTISAQARPFAGNCECSPPGSGTATGGYAAFTATGGTIQTGSVSVSASARSHQGNFVNQGAILEATGGTALVDLGDSLTTLLTVSVAADAIAAGNGLGANGGSATGGTAGFAKGAGGSLAAGDLAISATAAGGNGGNSDGETASATPGGDAQGGTVSLALAQTTQRLGVIDIDASAVAGNGGAAAEFSSESGGEGGNATGGTITAIGGIVSGNLAIDAGALAGAGGLDGQQANGGFGGIASAGISRGGSIALSARDNGASRFDVGSTVLDANGDIAGSIRIANDTTAPGAAMGFGSLAAYVGGEPGERTRAFQLSSIANAITVAGTAEVYASDVILNFSGSGRLEVGGFTTLNSYDGDIAIAHANNPGVLSLQLDGPIEIYAARNYAAGAGSVVASGDYLSIRANQAITASDTRSLGAIAMFAQGDVTVGAATTGSDLRIAAGRIDDDGLFSFQPGARAKVDGAVTVGGTLYVDSGGFAEFAAGSQVLADNSIWVRTGDDIVVASGASLVSDIDPVASDSIHLLAGDINFGPFSGDLAAPITTPIASLVIGGALDTNGQSLHLSGDAIDGTGSTISTGNLYLDVTDAPLFGPYSSDGGLLTANCHQSSACLGSVFANGTVEIGLASDSQLIAFSASNFDFDGSDFTAIAVERLDLNTSGITSRLRASNSISLRSLTDAVVLDGLAVEAPRLALEAGTDLLAAGGSLSSSGTITIEVGNDIVADAINADDGLDDGSDSGSFFVPGNMLVGSLTYGEGLDVNIRAGGNLSLGFVDPSGGDIELDAGQSLTLGTTAAGTAAIALEGDSVTFQNLRSSGPVVIEAGEGGVSGLSEVARVIDTTGRIAIDSLGAVALGDLFAGTDIAISSGAAISADALNAGNDVSVYADGAVALGAFDVGRDASFEGSALALGSGASGGTLTATAGSSLAFTNLAVGGDASLTASASLTGDNVASGSTLALTAGSIAVGAASGAAGLAATSSGTAAFTSLASNGGAVSLDAGGTVNGGSASAAGAVGIAGSSVALGSASFGAGLTINARTGGIAGAGLYQGTGGVDLRAAQGIAIGSVDTLGGIAMTAGAEARFVELRSRDGSIAVNAGGAIAGSSVAATGTDPAGDDSVALVAGGGITLDGANAALNTGSRAQDDFTARAGGAIAIARVDAGRDVVLAATTGAVGAANVTAGRDLSLSGQSVDLVAGSVARNLIARASAGAITGSGLTTAAGTIDLGASGNVAVGSLRAAGGALTASAGGSLAYTDLSATGALALTAGGAITGSGLSGAGVSARGTSLAVGAVTAGSGDLRLEATSGAVAFASASGANADIDAGGAVTGGTVSATGRVTLDAGGAMTLTGLTAASAAARSTGGAVSVGGIQVAGLLEAEATAITLAAPGALRVNARASAGDIGITAGGNLTVNATATGAITLASSGGSVLIGGVGQSGSSATGATGTQSVTGGGAVSVTAANAISVADSLSAAGALTMTAGGLVSLDGATSGQTIALRAADLSIGTSGSLGNANTQRIALSSTAPINLGTGASGGFAVDAAEFGRIQSGGDLMISALVAPASGAGAGSITVGSLTVNAGSGRQIGASGTFGLTASGLVDVNSTLAIAGAGSANTLMLTGEAVDLDYGNAALAVLDGANGATGRIVVNGRLITSLSSSAAADIVGKSADEVSLRLGRADIVRETGLFRTAALTLEGRDAILIQNSGVGTTFDDRRGLTVGALTVTGAADGRTLVVINGIIASATGVGAAQVVNFTTPIAPGSSVNGCALANISVCFALPDPEPVIAVPESILFGTSDLIQEEEDEESEVEDGVADGKNEAPPIDTSRIDDPAGLPLIDDPVTGAGNEDLWQPPEP